MSGDTFPEFVRMALIGTAGAADVDIPFVLLVNDAIATVHIALRCIWPVRVRADRSAN